MGKKGNCLGFNASKIPRNRKLYIKLKGEYKKVPNKKSRKKHSKKSWNWLNEILYVEFINVRILKMAILFKEKKPESNSGKSKSGINKSFNFLYFLKYELNNKKIGQNSAERCSPEGVNKCNRLNLL